jgi:RNA polymerase sigma factor (sigma-70 family)
MKSDFGTAPARTGTEVQLVARVQAGDSSAENELVSTYRRAVLLISSVRTRDREAARDLTQETLLAVLKAVREGKVRDPERLSAFVQGTARNVINNYLRSKARRPECDLESAIEPTANPIADIESAERQRLIRRELENFGDTDQQILLLSLVDGHSLVEVAERVKLSHDAVRARRSRMIRKITKKFSQLSHKKTL